jgi:hypothetical protein
MLKLNMVKMKMPDGSEREFTLEEFAIEIDRVGKILDVINAPLPKKPTNLIGLEKFLEKKTDQK